MPSRKGASVIRVATRSSPLARWQAERVISMLRNQVGDRGSDPGDGINAEMVLVSTTGDQRADTPIWEMGGTGVFVKEVSDAVLRGEADLAVHSAKDLPSLTPDGLVLAAFPERADARDAIVGSTLDDIPTGGRVGTGSVRRRAQLAALRPDLTFTSLRGNVATRVEKARELDAVVVAYAALQRLDLAHEAAEVLDPGLMLPQVGQGALAVECRSDDVRTRELLAAIDDPYVRAAVEAERAFLRELGGGCNFPCGALGLVDSEGHVGVDAMLASLDGRVVLRAGSHGADPVAVGVGVARRLLDDLGGRSILEALE